MQANKIITNQSKYIKAKEKQRQRTGAIGGTKKVSTMKRRYDNTTLDYYQALLDPEFSAVNNIEVKFPAPYDLPTKCINIKNSWETKANSLGNVLITWRPNYLCTDAWALEAAQMIYNERPSSHTSAGYGGLGGYMYSQVTINNESSLTGEQAVVGGLIYQPMKNIALNIIKYRLVSAKMTIEYIGRNDDESGTVTSGQLIGDMTPAAGVALTLSESGVPQPSTLKSIIDTSPTSVQFGQFDVIRDLPYGNVKSLRKGEIYSYYYYPIDHTTSSFIVTGQYGDTEKAKYGYFGTTYRTAGSVSDFARGIEATIDRNGSAYALTSDRAQTNRVTVPSYVVAIGGLSSTSSANEIRINLYENYECVLAPELSMISTAGGIKLNAIVANQVQQTMFSRMAAGIKNAINRKTVVDALNTAAKVVGNMTPLSNLGRLGKAVKAGSALLGTLSK